MVNALSRRNALAALVAAALLPASASAAPPAFSSRRIATRIVGRGPDVVLIPGLGAAPSVWNGLIRDVPDRSYHLIHVRGFAGLAPADNRSGRLLEPVADEIARYIAEARLGAPAIIGHSMGGLLAMLVALRAPARAGALMVVEMLPAGAGMVGGTASGMGFLASQLRGYFTQTEAGRRAFANILRDATPNGADSDQDVIAAALDEIASTDLGPQLARLRAPLTVVPALPADAKLREAVLPRFRAAYRPAAGARITPVGPSGHMVMFDQPAKFASIVRSFFAQR